MNPFTFRLVLIDLHVVKVREGSVDESLEIFPSNFCLTSTMKSSETLKVLWSAYTLTIECITLLWLSKNKYLSILLC